jgi:hypothetical protein
VKIKLQSLFTVLSTVALLIVPACFAQESGMVKPNTPEAQTALRSLDRASKIDRLNAKSYRGSDTSEAGIYYYRKAKEAERLATQLRSNHPVSNADITRALDTHHAARYTNGQ